MTMVHPIDSWIRWDGWDGWDCTRERKEPGRRNLLTAETARLYTITEPAARPKAEIEDVRLRAAREPRLFCYTRRANRVWSQQLEIATRLSPASPSPTCRARLFNRQVQSHCSTSFLHLTFPTGSWPKCCLHSADIACFPKPSTVQHLQPAFRHSKSGRDSRDSLGMRRIPSHPSATGALLSDQTGNSLVRKDVRSYSFLSLESC